MGYFLSCLFFSAVVLISGGSSIADGNFDSWQHLESAISHGVYATNHATNHATIPNRKLANDRNNDAIDDPNSFDINILADSLSSSPSFFSSAFISSFPASLASAMHLVIDDPQSFPNVTKPCFSSLIGIMANPKVSPYILDAFGKPRSGISQGGLAWPGNFDLCVGMPGMRHCMMPFNGSATAGTALGASTGGAVGAVSGMVWSWGLCLPNTCNDDDALSIANFLIFMATPPIADKIPQLAFLKNLTMDKGICRSAADPAPEVGKDAGMLFFFLLLATIGSLTVLGTAWDYFVVELKLIWRFRSGGSEGFGWSRMEEEVEGGGGGAGDEQIQVKTGKKEKHHPLVKVILCFSMLSNGRKVLSLAPAGDNIGCINGIRFLSLTWVILGHHFCFSTPFLANPFYVYAGLLHRTTIQPILNGTFSVDSFFVLSGLLTAYLFFKRNGEKDETVHQRIKTVFSMYVHRYLRLTPALGILMGFAQLLPMYMTSGPFSTTEEMLRGKCDKYWWYNILYINNFKQDAGQCVGHVWYLANDMQFFLLSPIFLYAFKFHEIAGLLTCAVFWLASVGSTIGISYENNSGILFPNIGANMQDIYVKPWTRMGPYIIGLVAGYFMYKYRRDRKRFHWIVVLAMWLISAAVALAVIYGLTRYYADNTQPSKAVNVIYLSFARSAWAVSVSWVILACSLGYGGPINTLLSWTPFGPVSRMNYSAYLYHLLVIQIVMQNVRILPGYSDYYFATCYLGLLVLSYGVAFLTTLWFESPFLGLEKLLFK